MSGDVKPVLFVGGPLDGTWQELTADERRRPWAAPVMDLAGRDFREFLDGSAVLDFAYVHYHVREIPIDAYGAGGRLWVACCLPQQETGAAILRAILQRDVAQELLAPRPRRWGSA